MYYWSKCEPLSIALFSVLAVSVPTLANDPGYVDLNGVQFTPKLITSIAYDDNVFREDNSVRRSSGVFIINPSAEFKIISGESEYALIFAGVSEKHDDVKDADYNDVSVTADIYHELNSRHRLNMELMAGWLHDSNSMDIKGHPPAYDGAAADVRYGFGAIGGPGQIDLFASIENKDYKRPVTSSVNEGKDSSETYYGGTFSLRLMPKTRALIEVSKRELRYTKIDDSGFEITSYMTGLNWDVTAKTNGYMKFGRRSRKTDVSGDSVEYYNAWSGGLSYQPYPYSLIQLATSRDYQLETGDTSESNFTRGDSIELTWEHEWSDRVRTASSLAFIDQDVQNLHGETLKARDVQLLGLSIDWDIRRWMTFSARYAYENRNEHAKVEGVTISEYSRNLYTLAMTVTL